MAQAARKPSPTSPENFHVLPKDKAAREDAKKPAAPEAATGHVESRDTDAGALTGSAPNEQLNQSTRTDNTDRSLVN